MSAYVEIPVASGNNGNIGSNGNNRQCRNNPICTSIHHHGPIPLGCWRWNLTKTTSTKNGRVLEECPGTNTNVTEKRTLIRSHSCKYPFGPGKGPKYCSEGCVTGYSTDIIELNNLIDSEPGSVLVVEP